MGKQQNYLSFSDVCTKFAVLKDLYIHDTPRTYSAAAQ